MIRHAATIIFLSVLPLGVSAQNHEPMDHAQHMATMKHDARARVSFPPPMRAHMLTTMRDHLAAVSDILSALAAGQYVAAAKLADERLGMQSPAAAGCQSEDDAVAMPMSPAMSTPMPSAQAMDHHMQQLMPEGMRARGQAMHAAASDFSREARRAQKTHNAKPALTALANVSQQCVACHAAYALE